MSKFLSTVDVADQIRTNTKLFKYVGIEAQLSRILDETSNITFPAAIVVLKDIHNEDNSSITSYNSLSTFSFSVYSVLSTGSDLTGGASQISFTDCFADLNSCLLNWDANPERADKSMSFDGSNFVQMTASRIVYESIYSIDLRMNASDGYQGDPYDNLQEIDIDVSSKPLNITRVISLNNKN